VPVVIVAAALLVTAAGAVAAFFAGAFWAGALLAGAFLAGVFSAGAFFAVATGTVLAAAGPARSGAADESLAPAGPTRITGVAAAGFARVAVVAFFGVGAFLAVGADLPVAVLFAVAVPGAVPAAVRAARAGTDLRPSPAAFAGDAARVRALVPSDFSVVERVVRRGRGRAAPAAAEAAGTAESGLPSRRGSWSCGLMHLASGRQHGQAAPGGGRGPCKHAVIDS
jgi:hypothetical protein